MRTAYVSLGSNIDAAQNLPRALAALRRVGDVRGVSAVYESEAVGPAGQPRFLNAVARIEVDLDDDGLRSSLRRIEADLGRRRTSNRYAPRPIDLDLVAAERTIDPEVAERAYLAVTLAEVAPELRLAETGETITAVAERLRSHANLRLRADLDLSAPGVRAP